MKTLDLTLPTPAENLALDEALIRTCEAQTDQEVLRFWEPQEYFVVLGYSNRMKKEVKLDSCLRDQVPILRRVSGGGTVLQGPGCLNYSLILRHSNGNGLSGIKEANCLILERHREMLKDLGVEAQIQGETDLTVGNLKFSGNSQRRTKNSFLYHGTFLLNFDLSKIEKYLAMPSRKPAYRQNRSHIDFLTNLHINAGVLKQKLISAWSKLKETAPCR